MEQHSLREAWQPCFSSKSDYTTLTLWHLRSLCGFGLSVGGRVKDTDTLYYPGFLAYSTLATVILAWPHRQQFPYSIKSLRIL